MADADCKALIEFFYPDLYDKCERAKAAAEGNPVTQGDPSSVTNNRFLDNLREITFFWLQDAVVMLTDEEQLANVAPWSTLLADDEMRATFNRFGEKVSSAMKRSEILARDQLLGQQDLLRAVETSWVSGTDKIAGRMSHLPNEVHQIAAAAQLEERPQFLRLLTQEVEHSLQNVFRRMLTVGASGEQSCPRGNHEETPCCEDAEDLDHGSATIPSPPFETPATQHFNSRPATTPLPSATNNPATTPLPNDEGNTDQPVDKDQESATWQAPLPVSRDTGTPTVKHTGRKPIPLPNSAVTGPRLDGYYLGNDLHTTSEVMKAREDILDWIEIQKEKDRVFPTNQDGSDFWGPTDGTREEKQGQARLRNRRRLLWEEVLYAAEIYEISEAAVVEELDRVQKELGSGISRVEDWALRARAMRKQAGAQSTVTILDEERKYQRTRKKDSDSRSGMVAGL